MQFLKSVLHNNYSLTDKKKKGLFGVVTEEVVGFAIGEVVNIVSLVDIVAPSKDDTDDCKANMYIISSLENGEIGLTTYSQVEAAVDVAEFKVATGEDWLVSTFSYTAHIDVAEAITIAKEMKEGGMKEHTYESPSLLNALIGVKEVHGGYLFTKDEDTLAFALETEVYL